MYISCGRSGELLECYEFMEGLSNLLIVSVVNSFSLPFINLDYNAQWVNTIKRYIFNANKLIFFRWLTLKLTISCEEVLKKIESNICFDGKQLPEFSKLYFSSGILNNYFTRKMNIITRTSLSQYLLKDVPVLLSSKDIQLKIIYYLNNISSKIALSISFKEQEIERLKEYRIRRFEFQLNSLN